MTIIYCEGKFLGEGEPCIPITDRGFLFGDGAYATIQVREGIPLFLHHHLTKLRAQTASFGLTMPPIPLSFLSELIARNGATTGIWKLRIFVTGGDSPLNRLPQRQGRLLMTLHPFEPLPFAPLRMILFPYPFSVCHASFKSLAHLNRYYVMEEAHQKGCDDAVTLSDKGYLLEASFGNLFWVEEKKLYTPKRTLPLHFGVTITSVMEIAEELGLATQEVALCYEDLSETAHYFRCNSMGGIRPITALESKRFSRDLAFEERLLHTYEEFVAKKNGIPKNAVVV